MEIFDFGFCLRLNIFTSKISNLLLPLGAEGGELDDIVTTLRLLELFFDDVLVDMIVGYTKLYSHREKADISFVITNEKIRLFLPILKNPL